ncbi:MAG TPA: ATP-binding cassette domain-containing protein [Gaiellaceae bacterium]|nr:ATP-binding cassette domain-containing protein [Gaiellaceae bacterium]
MTEALAVELRDVFRIHATSGQGAVALQGLTLTVRERERCVVLGPSGSGKSTLLRIAAGFDRPSAGLARTLGTDLGGLSSRRVAAFRAKHLGFLDQHYARSLSPALTAAENVELPLLLAGASASKRRVRALELLARVGLEERAGDTPDRLSGGEQQRVAACAALAHRPGILFADEPAGELDAVTAAAVYGLLAELAARDGTTLVVVSHDERATELADRVVHVRDGRISCEARRGEKARLVVGRGGSVRLPVEARKGAGIESHARWSLRDRELRLAGEIVAGEAAAPAGAEKPGGGEIVVELHDLHKSYGVGERRRHVLAGFDASFVRGLLVALEGRSGSGKTTLLHLVGGLERPDAGSIRVAGRELTSLDREQLAAHRRDHIAWVGQEPGLIPFATALENATLSLEIRDGGRRPEHEAEALAWLERLGLGDCVERIADRLSAGERQRVAIARALSRRPDVLLLDEPTARLDEESAALVADLLVAAARASNAAVVCATHDRAVAERADAVIAFGRRP